MDSTIAHVASVNDSAHSNMGQYYRHAKQALLTTLPDHLTCREKEMSAVSSFLESCVSCSQAGSLYISGMPGSGKTAVVKKSIENLLKVQRNCKVIYINCMSLKNSLAIFNNILLALENSETSLTAKEACIRIEDYFTSRSSSLVLVLDELDSLDSRNQDVLYTVFEWPALPQSTLALIGIANSLDLTDRILPRLQARPIYQPKVLNFPPYTKDEIAEVIQQRLSKIEGDSIFERSAVQYCAGKVAALAGDARMALDICRRAVETMEGEVRRQQVAENDSGKKNSNVIVRKIGIPLIQRIVNQVYNPSVKSTTGLMTIPVQQEFAVCILLLLLQKGNRKEIILGKFHESFCEICPKHGIKKIDQSEFHSLCCLIEARGIITLKRAKDTRNIKVSLKLNEKELEAALQNKSLMSSILNNSVHSLQ